jgi:multidrug efflux pump subunit AcrA (membrane-fusion protein)
MTSGRAIVELFQVFKDGSISTNGSGTVEEVDFRRGQSVAKNDSIGNSDDIVSEARLFQGQRTQSLNEEAVASSLDSTN